ncbi:MAG: hypothetical protein ACFFD4_37900 [Candidatus Odinarchaeota archaeon]
MHKRASALILVLFVISLVGTSLKMGVLFFDNGAQVKKTYSTEIEFSHEGISAENVELEIYNEDTLECFGKLRTGETGNIAVDLPVGNYYLEAITRGAGEKIGDGFRAYKEFSVTGENNHLVVEMKPKSDHSTYFDLTPTADKIATTEDEVLLPVEGDSHNVPVIVKKKTIEKACAEIVKEPEKLKTAVPNDVGDSFIEGNYMFIVLEEEIERVWHPMALVDSERGLTHKFTMEVFDGETFTLSGNIQAKGVVSVGGTYSTVDTYQYSEEGGTTATSGDMKTRYSEYRHVYQKLRVYKGLGFPIFSWIYIGVDEREFIDRWYFGSYEVKPYSYFEDGIMEAREEYRFRWKDTNIAYIKESEETTWSGTLSWSVAKKDVFGVEAKLVVSAQHNVKLSHYMNWVEPPGSWELEFWGGNQFDLNTYLRNLAPPPGGCPFVSEWTGHGYELDNNILPQSELYYDPEQPYMDWIDNYKLENKPSKSGNVFKLKISEFENEHSFFDKFQLRAVIHDPRLNIAVDPKGEILAYGNPNAPSSALFDGVDVLSVVSSEDDNYMTGNEGNELLLTFTHDGLENGARLVMRADVVVKESIIVEILTTSGWQFVGKVIPRIRWAHEIVNLEDYLPSVDNTGTLQIRLKWTNTHKLDFVGLDTSDVTGGIFLMEDMELISAMHSITGDVQDKLSLSDNNYCELLPGEELYLIFRSRMGLSTRMTDYILVSEGKYYSLG